MKTKYFLLAILPLILLCGNVVGDDQNDIYIIRIADAISPGTAEYIKSGIRTAEENGAACIIIELDTPGGLAESMRLIVQNKQGAGGGFCISRRCPGRISRGHDYHGSRCRRYGTGNQYRCGPSGGSRW